MAFEMEGCCCCSLKAGTITIGIVESIISFMVLVLSAAYAENSHELVSMADPSVVPQTQLLRSILILIAVSSGFHCILSILLIFGAETKRPFLLAPWLFTKITGVAIYIIGTLVAIVHHAGENAQSFVILHIFSALISSLISIYLFLVVFNYYKSLKRLNF